MKISLQAIARVTPGLPRRACAMVVATLLLAACAGAGSPTGTGTAPPDQPANIGVAKQEALAYQRFGAYDRALAAVAAQARAYIEQRAAQVSRPALVLDIDETSLSNWPQMVANDFGYIPGGSCAGLPAGPCGAHAWEEAGQAPVIAPTLALFNAARERGVAVFFISGRDEARRAATEANLTRAGYAGWAGLVLRPPGPRTALASEYKAPERARIAAQGYTIIANVGDQPSDLAGGHAERSFLYPNPYYRIP